MEVGILPGEGPVRETKEQDYSLGWGRVGHCDEAVIGSHVVINDILLSLLYEEEA